MKNHNWKVSNPSHCILCIFCARRTRQFPCNKCRSLHVMERRDYFTPLSRSIKEEEKTNYEGIIIHPTTPYTHKRDTQIVKFKPKND